MRISVTSGTGEGGTAIAAFDAALWQSHIANYNLIRLSSIIPPNSEIVREKPARKEEEFGHKLHLVYASEIQHEAGREAWAGIGWVLAEDGSGKGLFTEHEGHSEQEVTALIEETLSSMVQYREEKYGPIQHEVVGITCEGKPVCALVAAVYQAEGWD